MCHGYNKGFRKLTRNICFTSAALDVFQNPPLVPLSDQLPTQNTILSKVHVRGEDVGMLTVQRLALEVLAEGTVAVLVVLQGVVAISTQSARQNRYVAEHGLQRLIEDVGQLVLEVLRGDEGVEEVAEVLALHGFDLATGARHVGVRVERLPEVVEGIPARPRAHIQQDADVGVEGLPEGVEEPPMRVQLPLVPLLQTEDHLAGHDALLGPLELQVRVERHLRRVLVHVSLHGPLVDVVLGDAVLVHAHGGQRVESAWVDLLPSVRHDAYHDLLPPILAPRPGLVAPAEMADVLHDGVHGPRESDLVLVVHGDADEQLRFPHRLADVLSQLVASLHEVIGIASHGRVSHVRELDLVPAGQEAVENSGDLTLENELTVDQLHLLLHPDRGPDTASLLLSVGRSAVVLDLLV